MNQCRRQVSVTLYKNHGLINIMRRERGEIVWSSHNYRTITPASRIRLARFLSHVSSVIEVNGVTYFEVK